MQRLRYTCPDELYPTELKFWPLLACCTVISIGAILEFALQIEFATTIAALVVIVMAFVAAELWKRKKLSTFPCSKCGATSLEQSEDDENILLICHNCEIEWVTDYTTRVSDIDSSDL